MIEVKEFIEKYVENALPKGKVTDLCLLNESLTKEIIFDAVGHISFSKERSFGAYFRIKNSPSLAALKDVVAMLELKARDSLDGYVIILLAEYLSQKKQEILRESKIGFIDGTGNAWIDTSNLLVDKRGNKPSNASRHGRIQSVFADKATLISRMLFYSGARGVREISAMLVDSGFSVTPGYVSKVVNSLISEHYAKRANGRVELVNKELFLEDWVNIYKQKRVRREIEGWYLPAAKTDDLAFMIGSRLGESGVLTDRAGSFFVDPYTSFESIDILARDKDSVVGILRDMGASPVYRGANINVIKPHYFVSSFYRSQEIRGVRVASDIQLYLDLCNQPKRGLEAAEHLYRRRILPMIKKDENRE